MKLRLDELASTTVGAIEVINQGSNPLTATLFFFFISYQFKENFSFLLVTSSKKTYKFLYPIKNRMLDQLVCVAVVGPIDQCSIKVEKQSSL